MYLFTGFRLNGTESDWLRRALDLDEDLDQPGDLAVAYALLPPDIDCPELTCATLRDLAGDLFDLAPLPLRLDLVNHSPTGFECGYQGSGPSQLAAAMVALTLGDAMVRPPLYLAVHDKLICPLPRDRDWLVWSCQVEAIAQGERRSQAARQ